METTEPEQSQRVLTNRAASAHAWVSKNRDKLHDPEIVAWMVKQFGITEGVASHLVSLGRTAV